MIKKFLKKIFLYELYKKKRGERVTHGKTKLNILKTFPLFESHGWGLYPIRAKLTIKCINQLVPALSSFCNESTENRLFQKEIQTYFSKSPETEQLGKLFNKYGSDKATTHNYYLLYASILKSQKSVNKIFEIGLGTNNIDIVSTMGKKGHPGASLRAFRDFCPNAEIYGADFDSRILFQEKGIKTFYVDQTEPNTLEAIRKKIGNNFDLMIDDGLHSPNANLHSLKFFLPLLKVGGYAVIEDVNFLTADLWKVISSILEQNYVSTFIKTKASCVFVVKKLKS